jgi:long-chain acyl-CoA synthetase
MTTVIGPLRRAMQVAPGRSAVRCGDVELTYDQTWQRARRLLGGLRQLGVGAGDRVAVVGPNCHRYLELYQAVPGAGMALVPLNQRHTAAELRYALEDSGAKVLFAGDVADIPPGVVESVIDLEDGYESLLAGAPAADFPDDLPADTLAGLFYTGGTTGAAKGVMLTHRNLVANALHFQVSSPFGPDTCWLIVAPMFHAAGSIAVLATVWHAGRQVVLPAVDPGVALDLIEAERVTATLVVPTVLAAISDEQLARPRDVSALRLVSHGGAPVATETLRRAHATFPDAELMHIYGATETSPIATILRHEEDVLDSPQARSCGQPAVGVEVAVIEMVSGSPVEIVSGGENVYSTGGRGGALPPSGRARSSGVRNPDARWGEVVHAVVVPRADVDEAELLRHCRELIAGYKLPKRVELRTEPLPKSGAGKVLKRELRAPYWEGHEAMVAGA